MRFLEPYDSTGVKDSQGKAIYTHTSLQPRRSYNIPYDKEIRNKLHRLIADSVCNRKAVFLTEKPQKISSIKVDIDLKYPMSLSSRQHTDKHIEQLLSLYNEAISKYVKLPENQKLDAYVLQRNNPYPHQGNIKDGLHILYPEIYCDTDIQHAIRHEVLKRIDLFLNNPEIGVLKVKNTKDDVVDLAVISRNVWQLYGSRKPNLRPYTLYKVWSSTVDADKNVSSPKVIDVPSKGPESVYNLINKLSTHNIEGIEEFKVAPEFADTVKTINDQSKKNKNKPKMNLLSKSVKQTKKKKITEEELKVQVEEAKELVRLLAPWRADDYKSWIEVGLCLNNISSSLKDSWIEFSKMSDKWQDSDEETWDNFNESPGGLNIGSLHRWARTDNPKKYKQIQSLFLENIIVCSVTGNSQDVAQVIYKMYKHHYKCLDSKGKRWVEYVNHSWQVTKDGISLKKRLGKEVLEEYLLLITRYTALAIASENERRDSYMLKADTLTKVSHKLRNMTFKNLVLQECVLLFHDKNFEKNLDANPFLVGLENGVYDLKANKFRDGTPEDHVTMSTGNDFPEVHEGDVDILNETSTVREVEEIFNFLKQVLPIYEVRRYTCKFLASCLEGYNNDEKFHIFTGSGGNGKSKLITLFEMCFGDYCFKLPVTFITGKRTAAGQATPEIEMGLKCRFGSSQESEEGAKLNMGVVKEYTGNDGVYYRGLYSDGGNFTPQFSLLHMCNVKPKLTNNDDDGTWRRLVVVDFISRFVEGEPTGKYEFKKDTSLTQSFPSWAPWFFVILTEYYKLYKKEGLVMPKEIEKATMEYRKDSDAYALFIDDNIVEEEGEVLKLEQAYTIFKEWFRNEFDDKPPPRRAFKHYLERKFNKSYGIGSKAGWAGYTVKFDEDDSYSTVSQI